MGPVEVPADAYWGAQTQRSLEHFAIGDERLQIKTNFTGIGSEES